MAAIRTLIVDDGQTVRRALHSILDTYPDLEVIGEASNGEQAIKIVHELHPDLIFMDVSMPVLDGLAAAEVIKTFNPDAEIVMFSNHKIRELSETARILGLNGYVVKEEIGSLLNAIDAVLHHHSYFPDIDATDEGTNEETFMVKIANESKSEPDYMADKAIASRAYDYWEQRGKPFGSSAVDWFKAIEDIHREMTRASGSGT